MVKQSKLKEAILERGIFKNYLSFPGDNGNWAVTILLISLAYLLSFWIRLEWIDFAQAHYNDEEGNTVYFHPEMVSDGVALPNTHDSFYFGSILQKAHLGLHQENNLIPSALKSGMITMLPYWLLKLFPDLTIEMLLLWLPVYVAGIVCIPILLIGRLYGSHAWGFCAACLAGVTHSYYNRTLAGYYDTDMFSITIPAFALYFLLSASRKRSLNYVLLAAITLYLYRFFYASGQAITGALSVAFIAYSMGLVVLEYFFIHERNWKKALGSSTSLFCFKGVLIVSFAAYAEAWSYGVSIEKEPARFVIGFIILLSLRLLVNLFTVVSTASLQKEDPNSKDSESRQWGGEPDTKSLGLAFPKFRLHPLILPLIALFFSIFAISNGGVRDKIFAKLDRYVSAGKGISLQSKNKEKGYNLSYLDVFSTVREASGIPSDVVRNRILADTPSCSCPRCIPPKEKKDSFIIPTSIFGLFGVLLLIMRYWEFCIAIPFLAIAYYCFEGAVGLRFTVHVGNVAAIGIIFLLLVIFTFILKNLVKIDKRFELSKVKISWSCWLLLGTISIFLIRPNINHAKVYHSHVVYPTKTIEVLRALDTVSQPDDFVVTWWDYGSGCWFYGGARTFTSPAHQTFDNFLTSEILRSTSARRAINLSRLKTETYVKIKEEEKKGQFSYGTAVQAIFKDGQADVEFYQGLLKDLEKGTYPLPPSSRDVFLFLPYEILRIFPTILSFSSRNLYFTDSQSKQLSASREPPLTILHNGKREGFSLKFENGFFLDQNGNLRVEGKQSGSVKYSQLWKSSGINGSSAKIVDSILIEGMNIKANPDFRSNRILLFVEKYNSFVLLSNNVFNSTFGKRFLIESFDEKAFSHEDFSSGASPVRQPFMTQAEWVTGSGNRVSLNMRGGYRIEADLSTLIAKLPGSQGNVPFSFHRRSFDKNTGKMIELPSQISKNAKFHLVQSTMPIFAPGRTYEVPQRNGVMSVSEIAQTNGIEAQKLAHYLDCDLDKKYNSGEKIEIPARGYQMTPAWFFMDQEAFDSVLVKGFLMENLPEANFEKIYASPWGKVYKMK